MAEVQGEAMLSSFPPNERRMFNEVMELGVPLLGAIHLFFDNYTTVQPLMLDTKVAALKLQELYNQQKERTEHSDALQMP